MTDCPDNDRILEILAGSKEDSSDELRAHVEHCPRCQCLMSELRGVLQVAGAYEAFEAGAAEEIPTELADRIFDRVNLLYEKHVLSASGPQMRSLAVMFTDMADSTKYAESAGGRAAFEKRQRHNELLVPLIDAHQGTLVNVIGDARQLVIFDETADAVRCAIAMQRRLDDYNQSEQVDVESLEIHIRAGIHYGKVIVFRERGHVEVAGSAVNVAARVEAGGEKQTDEILMSEAALEQVHGPEDFATEPVGPVEAKGISHPIQLHRLLWRKEAVHIWKADDRPGAAQAPLTLAATTAERPNVIAEQDENRRACHCMFVDPVTDRGYIVPVWVQVESSRNPGIRCRVECDRVMQAAGGGAIASAFDVLQSLGFLDARAEEQAIEWWIDETSVSYQGASLGLAIALATVAAYTGTQIDTETAVTGAVDGRQVVPVTNLGSKWAALRDSGRFKKLVLPSANLNDLPAESRRDDKLQVIDVPDVEAAIVDVLGPALGLAARRLAAATAPSGQLRSGDIDVQLWVQPAAKQSLTRDISIVPEEDVHSWFIGQKIRICAQVNRDCHLSLVNIGATGNVTVLIPNSLHPATAVRAGQVVTFPGADDRFSLELQGPPGRERVIAIASDHALKLTSEDFDQSGKIVCARPTTRNIAIVAEDLSEHELGRCEIEFYVSERNTPTAAETRPVFRELDLG